MGISDREPLRDLTRRMLRELTRDSFSQQNALFSLKESRRDFSVVIAADVLRVENAIRTHVRDAVESPVGVS